MKKHLFSAFHLFAGELFAQALGFAANIYLAHTLQPDGFGLIIGSSFFLSYSLLFSDSGLRMLGFLETSKPEENRQFTLSHILLAKIALAPFAFIILYTISFFTFPKTILHTICTLYLLNIFYDALFIDWYFKGLQRFKSTAYSRIVSSVLYVSLLFILVRSPADIIKVPLIFFASNMVSIGILFSLIPATPFRFSITFSIKKYFSVFRHSLVLGVSTFLNQVNIHLPPIILVRFAGNYETGIFGAAIKVVFLVKMIDRVFATIFFSNLPGMWHESRIKTEKYLQTVLNITFIFSFLISLLLCVASGTIMDTIFGDKYVNSSIMLSLICWFFPLTIVNSIFAYGLIGIDHKREYLKATTVGFFINIIAIVTLIQMYGIYGAGIAMVVGELAFIILCYHAFRKFCSVNFYSTFIKVCAVSAVSYLSVYYIPVHSLIKGVIAAVIFISFSLIIRVIKKSDIALVKETWNKS
jgi:O-antigen/teichoic acid export membrane protein